MRLAILLALGLLLPALALAPAAQAGPEWLPVCHDKDVRAGPYVHLHVGVDCERNTYLTVCPPWNGACIHRDFGNLLA